MSFVFYFQSVSLRLDTSIALVQVHNTHIDFLLHWAEEVSLYQLYAAITSEVIRKWGDPASSRLIRMIKLGRLQLNVRTCLWIC